MNLTDVILLATFALLGLALLISTASMVRRMVNIYIVQAYTLVGITFLTAVEVYQTGSAGPEYLLVGSVALLPLLLAFYIRPLLARATVTGDFSLLRIMDRRSYPEWIPEAEQAWLEHGKSRIGQFANILINLFLIVLAFFIAFQLVPPPSTSTAPRWVADQTTVAISLGLLLIGLLVMIVKSDIISQVMGLLVMEHGLFLAAIKAITNPALAVIFVISMFAYILITLFILAYLLPNLHKIVGSIEIDEINRTSTLKG